jgi:hypothetical protein
MGLGLTPSLTGAAAKGIAMTRLAAAALAATLATAALAVEPAATPAADAPAPPAPAAPPAATPSLAAAPPAGLTSGSDGGWSFQARAGTYVPVMGTFNAYRPGIALEAALGRRLGAGLSLEVGGLYVKARTTLPVAAVVPDGAGVATLSELTMAGGLATLWGTLASGPLELHAGAGLGWYWAEQYQRVDGALFSGGYLSHDTALGGHAAAGGLVRLTPGLHGSLDLRYTVVEPFLFGRHQRADGIGVAAGLGYRF